MGGLKALGIAENGEKQDLAEFMEKCDHTCGFFGSFWSSRNTIASSISIGDFARLGACAHRAMALRSPARPSIAANSVRDSRIRKRRGRAA